MDWFLVFYFAAVLAYIGFRAYVLGVEAACRRDLDADGGCCDDA